MSQISTASVRDLLPENCCLNLEDDDEGTLNLVTEFTDSYLTHELKNSDYSGSDSSCDSDGNISENGHENGSSDDDVSVPFDVRAEDHKYDDEVSQFRERGCRCRLDNGEMIFLFVLSSVLNTAVPLSTSVHRTLIKERNLFK